MICFYFSVLIKNLSGRLHILSQLQILSRSDIKSSNTYTDLPCLDDFCIHLPVSIEYSGIRWSIVTFYWLDNIHFSSFLYFKMALVVACKHSSVLWSKRKFLSRFCPEASVMRCDQRQHFCRHLSSVCFWLSVFHSLFQVSCWLCASLIDFTRFLFQPFACLGHFREYYPIACLFTDL